MFAVEPELAAVNDPIGPATEAARCGAQQLPAIMRPGEDGGSLVDEELMRTIFAEVWGISAGITQSDFATSRSGIGASDSARWPPMLDRLSGGLVSLSVSRDSIKLSALPTNQPGTGIMAVCMAIMRQVPDSRRQTEVKKSFAVPGLPWTVFR